MVGEDGLMPDPTSPRAHIRCLTAHRMFTYLATSTFTHHTFASTHHALHFHHNPHKT